MIIDVVLVHGFTPANTSLGELSFRMSPDHPTVTSYEARVRSQGSSTILATQNLGKPTPDEDGICYVNIAALLNAQAAGNYEVTVAAISPSGTTDSSVSNAFTVPLS